MVLNQKGFAPVALIIPIIVILGVGFLIFSKVAPQKDFQHPAGYLEKATTLEKGEWPILWGPPGTSCEDKPSVKYSASPINLEDIKFILPMGELREGHIIPGDHAGIVHEDSPTTAPTKVYAPADGTIVRVERHPYDPPANYPQNTRHYHIYLVHSCTFFTGFVHLTDFTDEVLSKSPELKKLHDKNLTQMENTLVNIPVKAGQQIGTAHSFELLGIVTVDLEKVNKGFINPQSYQAENWKVYAVSPFDYFEEPLKSNLYAKNPRSIEPRGGKIDFDIDGKIVGSWFEQGSGGFRDDTKDYGLCGNWPCPYWEGHLALVYDFIDPDQLRVSLGYNPGLATGTPYGVKGNKPDFKDIGAEDGIVKYELVSLNDISRERGYISETQIVTQSDDSKLLGTMLVQLLEDQKLKMEIFPGKTKDQVNNYTNKALMYER